MNWLKENWFKLIIAASVLIAALSMRYYYIDYVPQRDAQKQLQETVDKNLERTAQEASHAEQQRNLNFCLLDADTAHERFWKAECEALGRGENCLLPQFNAERVDKSTKEQKEFCFRRYPQNF